MVASIVEVDRRPSGRPRPQDLDRLVGARIRERRVTLGLTQQQMAELIGVTYQQAHKYEKGLNRIAAGRLFTIAQALGVEVGAFFEGLDSTRPDPTETHRTLLDLVRNFVRIGSPPHREALCALARVLASEAPPPPDRQGDRAVTVLNG